MQDGRKAVWSIPYVSVAFFSKFKAECYCKSFFEIAFLKFTSSDNLGFSRVYSNFCSSGSFEPEIITIGL